MSGYEVIPQEHIDWLAEHDTPEYRASFDQKYGPGSAESVLTPPEDEDRADPSTLSIWGRVKDAARGIPYGVQDAVNETINFGADVVEDFDDWASRQLDDLGVPSRVIWGDGEGLRLGYYHEVQGAQDRLVGGTSGVDNDADPIQIRSIDEPITGTGKFVGGVSQFVTGMVGAGKFTKLVGLRGAFVNGALADSIVFDPDDPNITRVLEEFGVDLGAFGDLIRNDPDDNEYINRLRNAADGAIGGAILEAIGWSIKAVKARAKGDISAADEFFKQGERALGPVDAEIKRGAKAVAADAERTIKETPETIREMDEIAERAKVEADGQINMDLGDVPLKDAEPAVKAPKRSFKVTPEQAEKIRFNARLAASADHATKTKTISWRSIRTAESYDDVMDEIAAVSEVYADEFAKIKGGSVQRWRTVAGQSTRILRELTEITGRSKKDLMREFFGGYDDVTKMAATLKAREDYVFTLGKDIKRLGQALYDAKADDGATRRILSELGLENLNQLRAEINAKRELFANLSGAVNADRTNIARAMNAMKMARKQDPRLKALLEGRNDVFRSADVLADAIGRGRIAAEDPKLLKIINGNLENIRKTAEGLNHYRINALLSGPGTQLINITSNLINTTVIPTTQVIGGAVRGDARMVRHGAQQLRYQIAGSWEAIQAALSAGYNKRAILDPFDGKIEGEDIMQRLNGPVNELISLPTRFLMMMDEFFKQAHYRGRVLADADAEAAAKGLQGAERAAFMQRKLRAAFDDTGQALDAEALLQTQRATFTEPLMGGWAKSLQKMAIDYPAVRFFLPFVRTPINIVSQAIQTTPGVAVISKRFREDMQAGGIRGAQALGRQILGLSIVTATWTALSNNRVTGSGPADPEIRKAWMAAGNVPYAINMGEDENGNTVWIDYSRMEPLSNLISITADLMEITQNEYGDYEEADNIALGLLLATAENTVNKTFTQGISDFIALIDSRDPQGAQRAIRNIAASFTPNILNQLNGDEAYREVRNVTDAFKVRDARFNEVDPKRNILGEIVWRDNYKWLPIGTVTKADDPILQKITDMAILDRTISTAPNRTIRVPDGLGGLEKLDLATVPYKPGQSLYDAWLERMGTIKISGRTLREELENVFESSSFQNAAPGILGGGPGTQSGMISDVLSAYRNAAKWDIPELKELLEGANKGRASVIREKRRQQMSRDLFPNAPLSSDFNIDDAFLGR